MNTLKWSRQEKSSFPYIILSVGNTYTRAVCGIFANSVRLTNMLSFCIRQKCMMLIHIITKLMTDEMNTHLKSLMRVCTYTYLEKEKQDSKPSVFLF